MKELPWPKSFLVTSLGQQVLSGPLFCLNRMHCKRFKILGLNNLNCWHHLPWEPLKNIMGHWHITKCGEIQILFLLNKTLFIWSCEEWWMVTRETNKSHESASNYIWFYNERSARLGKFTRKLFIIKFVKLDSKF